MKRLKDVALLAGVSEGTASLALNNKPGVNAGTRQKVREAAKTLGYTPNTIARGLALQKSNTIGLVVTDLENPFFGSVTRFIDEDIRQRGYNLILSISNDQLALEDEIIARFISCRVDGVIIVPTVVRRKDFTVFEALTAHHIPYVFTTSFYPELEAHVVMAALKEGAYLLTKYLLDLGHQDILLFTTEDPAVIPSKLRIDGYLEAFQEARLTPRPDAMIPCHRPDFFTGYSIARKIFSEQKPDAIMAINDILALGIEKAALEWGYRIPQDISLAGYDDVFFSSLSQIPITTVRQNIPAICFETVQTLMRLIATASEKMRQIFIPTEVIVRKSTGKAYASMNSQQP